MFDRCCVTVHREAKGKDLTAVNIDGNVLKPIVVFTPEEQQGS